MRERKASQAAGQLLLAKMRAVMAKAPVGIAFTRNRRFELVSDEFNRLLGYEGSGLDGEDANLIKKPFSGKDLAAKVREVLESAD